MTSPSNGSTTTILAGQTARKESRPTLQQNGDLQDPGPIGPRLGQDLPDPLNTEGRLVLDSTRYDGPVDERNLSADKDEITELGTPRQGRADAS